MHKIFAILILKHCIVLYCIVGRGRGEGGREEEKVRKGKGRGRKRGRTG